MGLLVSVVCRTASLVWELLEGDNGREFEIGFPIQGTGTVPGMYILVLRPTQSAKSVRTPVSIYCQYHFFLKMTQG